MVLKGSVRGEGWGPWGFNFETGAIGRDDGKYFEMRVVQHPGGWPIAAVYEEPGTPQPDDGSPRIVGQVIIDVDAQGRVGARKAKGLNGETLELKPSSVSKGELAKSDPDPDRKPVVFETNPQRIVGFVGYFVNRVEAHPEGTIVLTLDEFVAQSTDGRSLAALAKAGLLKG
jgi:hypothetical protein